MSSRRTNHFEKALPWNMKAILKAEKYVGLYLSIRLVLRHLITNCTSRPVFTLLTHPNRLNTFRLLNNTTTNQFVGLMRFWTISHEVHFH